MKDSNISIHLLIRIMKYVGEHVASSVGEGCDMGESRRECGNPGQLSGRTGIKHLFTLSLT